MAPEATNDAAAANDDTGVVVNHVGLCTPDLARAQRFYEDVFGFTVERELRLPDEATADFLGLEPPVDLHAVYLRRGEFVLELLSYARVAEHPPRVMNAAGLTHLSLSVHGLNEVVDAAISGGAEVVSRSPYVAMLRDPDGQLLEVLPMSYRERLAGG